MDTFTHHAYEQARRITRAYGKRYHFATRFLPHNQREAIRALYAFFRIPDEIVDNPASEQSVEDQLEALESWKAQWIATYTAGTGKEPVLHAAADTFHTFRIPYAYSEAFFDAMKRDLTQSHYKTYADLQTYMYGSAEVVGLMCTYVLGFRDGALPYAAALGEAMQLTNFLRDVREDYEDRNRIYLPKEDMTAFEVTEEHIQNRCCDENFQNLMRYEISRARELYRYAEAGIPLLSQHARFGVFLAARLYASILEEIEQVNYDVFHHTISPSKRKKLTILWSCFKMRGTLK